MKKRSALIACIGIFATTSLAAVLEEGYEEDSISIEEAGAFESDKHVIIEAGEDVKFTVTVYQAEFFGSTIINANANLDNPTDTEVKAVYSISFHDEDGKLIGCHQGSWDLDPGQDIDYGSGMIYADADSIASVTDYKLRTQVFEIDDE